MSSFRPSANRHHSVQDALDKSKDKDLPDGENALTDIGTGWEGSPDIPSKDGGDSETDFMSKPPYKWESTGDKFKVKYTSSCWCGNVGFEFSQDPLSSKCCHCHDCQRLHGAPFQHAVIFPKAAVRLSKNEGESLDFFSTEKKKSIHYVPCKVACTNCRSPMFDEGRSTMIAYPGTFKFKDGKLPASFHPSCHIFYSQRTMDLADGLPKWSGMKNKSELLGEDACEVTEKHIMGSQRPGKRQKSESSPRRELGQTDSNKRNRIPPHLSWTQTRTLFHNHHIQLTRSHLFTPLSDKRLAILVAVALAIVAPVSVNAQECEMEVSTHKSHHHKHKHSHHRHAKHHKQKVMKKKTKSKKAAAKGSVVDSLTTANSKAVSKSKSKSKSNSTSSSAGTSNTTTSTTSGTASSGHVSKLTGATAQSTVDAGPNGSEAFLTNGISKSNPSSGWAPAKVTMDELVYTSLESAGSTFSDCKDYFSIFEKYGALNNIPPILLASFAMQESSCNPSVVGDSGGAFGLMQITSDKCGGAPNGNCNDPDFNVKTAAAYFATTLASNGGSVLVTIGQYNGWTPGMTYTSATAAASTGCCVCQNNLDYLQQLLNWWMQGKSAYSGKAGTFQNLAVCGDQS
ncbi:hypothetical protein E5Q_01687 [Mixia osmundae IAM 14324]|uniref:CENP-V/GFA domain-containing protein n=1 Tax=Mixia osmundae (strain CBS 9802 / IAM 14324 / JCM 22182 / KY 12970) TaxID=764103 RepID=G7DWT5_MIXOS|nr:hypothetical protein E5Q_01687 [Mixia osmundae IAM 14324]